MYVSLYQIHWPSQLHVNLFPHFLEKNKDEAGQDPSKPWSASNWIGMGGRKPHTKKHQEYPSTSILGKMYDTVKKEDFDKPLNGMNVRLGFLVQKYLAVNVCFDCLDGPMQLILTTCSNMTVIRTTMKSGAVCSLSTAVGLPVPCKHWSLGTPMSRSFETASTTNC